MLKYRPGEIAEAHPEKGNNDWKSGMPVTVMLELRAGFIFIQHLVFILGLLLLLIIIS